jgi:beta-galactosidase
MRHFAAAVFLMTLLPAFSQSSARRETQNFNADWRFLRADPVGASNPVHPDGDWAVVSAPHTYNDTDTFDTFSLPGHRGEQDQWSGRTWYRKHFAVPEAWKDRKVYIEFEAVRQVAEVYLNGHKLGTAKSGFTPFGFDLTPHLKIGQDNVLAVMVDNRFQKDPWDPKPAAPGTVSPNLAELSKRLMEQIPDTLEELQADQIPWNNPHWHPAHGGIYRNVRLIITDPLHLTLPLYSFLQTEGPYAYATSVTAERAEVGVDVTLRNDHAVERDYVVSVTLRDADGRLIRTLSQTGKLPSQRLSRHRFSCTVQNPRLWEPGSPHVYRVAIAVESEGRTVDATEIPLGLRHVRWDATTGLWINDAHYKLHGWGQKATNEWPGLGAAQPDWLQAYTLQLMKEAGGNFVRWGHVAAGPAQIAAGDALGLVALQPGVDGEHDTRGGAWALRVATFRDVIIYFRNHPSILIWEGGNQKVSREHAAELRALMDRYDPHGQRAYAHRRADPVTAEFMHVGIGTEGGREIARLPVVEGEYNREESPRRVWDDASPPRFGYPEAKGQTYQLTSEQFAVNQVKHYVTKLGAPEHAGGANWIFSDSTSGGRVAVEVARASGEVDGVRLPKEAFAVCQVMFTYSPRVHLIGHWTYPAGTRKTVYAAANTGGEVELFLNGRSLGRAKPDLRFLYTFPDVAFEPGELKAVAHDLAGRAAATSVHQTTGAAVALRLTPKTGPDGWRADGADVALFDVEAVDTQGRRVPTIEPEVEFSVSGPATWRGGYNSGREDSINHTVLRLEAGVNRVALRSSRTAGAVTLTARSPGLQPASSLVTARAVDPVLAPAWPAFTLPATPDRQPAHLAPKPGELIVPAPGQVGRYIKTSNYTGPSSYLVHVEMNARDGRNAYVDVDSPLKDLPASLVGADWVQVANRDALYHAVDLMEIAVPPGTRVTIAHDDRLPRPPWLTRDFAPTPERMIVAGRPMTLFARTVAQESGLTFGPNTEDSSQKEANMYLVFVSPAPRPRGE